MPYFISFEPSDKSKNILITPIEISFNVTERVYDKNQNIITIPEKEIYNTILESHLNKESYILIQLRVCNPNNDAAYSLNSAFNSFTIINGTISKDTKYFLKIIENTNDIELDLESAKNSEVFFQYTGVNNRYPIDVNEINIKYDGKTKILCWNQPIEYAEFNYTIYIDKKNNIKNKEYILYEVEKLKNLILLKK